jgi:hypothetical protein
MDGKMITFTTEDREKFEGGIPVQFASWIQDKEDTEKMLREQIYAQQKEIDRLNVELMEAKKK